jgi:hypothetical protein
MNFTDPRRGIEVHAAIERALQPREAINAIVEAVRERREEETARLREELAELERRCRKAGVSART